MNGSKVEESQVTGRRVECLLAVTAVTLIVIGLCTAAGCKGTAEVVRSLPPGTQLQSSTFGVKVAPQAVDGTPFVMGSHSTIVTTAQPQDAGVNLNRFEGTAPFTTVKSTVASGPIGDEIKKAGGPDALKIMLPGKKPSLPFPVDVAPRTPAGNPKTSATDSDLRPSTLGPSTLSGGRAARPDCFRVADLQAPDPFGRAVPAAGLPETLSGRRVSAGDKTGRGAASVPRPISDREIDDRFSGFSVAESNSRRSNVGTFGPSDLETCDPSDARPADRSAGRPAAGQRRAGLQLRVGRVVSPETVAGRKVESRRSTPLRLIRPLTFDL